MCYDMDPPFSGQPHQISPDPDQNDPQRLKVLRMLAKGGALLLLLGGLRVLYARDRPLWLGAILVVPGLWVLWKFGRRLYRRMLELYRLRKDQCVHCGYPHAGLKCARCPECGEDPVGGLD